MSCAKVTCYSIHLDLGLSGPLPHNILKYEAKQESKDQNDRLEVGVLQDTQVQISTAKETAYVAYHSELRCSATIQDIL
jgi:hypothetical protein